MYLYTIVQQPFYYYVSIYHCKTTILLLCIYIPLYNNHFIIMYLYTIVQQPFYYYVSIYHCKTTILLLCIYIPL